MPAPGLVVAALPSELPRGTPAWQAVIVGARGAWTGEPRLPGEGPVVITGTCGALMACPRGTLVVPDILSTLDGGELRPDETLVQALRHAAHAAGIDLAQGRFAEAEEVVDAPAARASLAARTGASFVDLESAPLARACERSGRPWAVLRIVVDSPDERLDWLRELLGGFPSREPGPRVLLPALLRRPRHVLPLLGLWRLVTRGRRDVGRVLAGASGRQGGQGSTRQSGPPARTI